ncbi:MAG: membrane protein [Alteromonadaceae bacterium]|jgi:membrane protein
MNMPLYPKLSSIYNKIMQLAIAIAFIILLMNLWLFNHDKNKQSINDHFYYVGQQYLKQNILGLSVVIKEDKKSLQDYVDNISQLDWLKELHVYDVTGQLIASSESHYSIKDLYGISPHKLNKSEEYIPFVSEIRTDKLHGYLRMTIEKKYLTGNLLASHDEQYSWLRLMMIIAGVVGFLLTRGLNRFSRQGFRVSQNS